jgi:hypothetical protein
MMKNRFELHPDLIQCELEDRVLPAAPVMMPIPFLPYNSSSNSFVIQGFSSGGSSTGGSTLYPGEPSFYLRLGFNLGSAGNGSGNGSGSSGQSSGSTFSINGYANSFVSGGTAAQLVLSTGGGGGGGGSSDSSSGSGSGSGSSSDSGASGGLGSTAGYGANISSGYSFAINSANNYGMAATTLGSVPVHTFAGGGDMLDAPNQDNPADPYGTNPSAPMTNPETGVGPQGPNAKLYQNLLGKNPGQIGSRPAMPSPQPAP